MKFARGDVLIALIPNADGSPPKARPVLVVQSDTYNAKIANLVVASITSNLTHATDPASLLIEVKTPDGKAAGLRQDSVVSCINLTTIAADLVARRIGGLSPRDDPAGERLLAGRTRHSLKWPAAASGQSGVLFLTTRPPTVVRSAGRRPGPTPLGSVRPAPFVLRLRARRRSRRMR